MENLIEYIRENGKKNGKRGVLYCGIDPNNPESVVLGFSICNKRDRFDYIEGIPHKGFGVKIAKIRAEKWSKIHSYHIFSGVHHENISKLVVKIPPSIVKDLSRFVDRCKKYYKDKNFPNWVNEYTKLSR